MSQGEYSAVEMEERKSDENSGRLEDPFDEDFWEKVCYCYCYLNDSIEYCS